ncbi:MAG: FKBP-type peptidyl-prolyl cis-trans isomerase [Thermoplasmatota archaeon]
MDDEKLCLISIGAAIVLFLVLAGMTYVDEEGYPWEGEKKAKKDVLLIQEGDEVSLDYTGRLLGPSGGPGPVFDTSYAHIANNDSIPKSISFKEKPTYDDLTFTVGSETMIRGFDMAVLGKKEGQTFTVAIPYDMGYGPAYDELKYTLNVSQTIPLRQTLDRDAFDRMYPVIDPEEMDLFVHPFWGWNVHIISADAEDVVFWNDPVLGQDYLGFLWNTTIVDISSERNVITLEHKVSEIDPTQTVFFEMVASYDPDWGDKAREVADDKLERPPEMGFVTWEGGRITIDYNQEVAGKTLYFQIHINSIKRG